MQTIQYRGFALTIHKDGSTTWRDPKAGPRKADSLHAAKICIALSAKLVPTHLRFLKFVEVKQNGCHDWTGATSKIDTGFVGRFMWNGRNWRAPRVSYSLFVATIPAGVLVCHTCDRPICVNPTHLFLGTDAANRLDCKNKGRMNHWQGPLKLTTDQVQGIRDYLDLGESTMRISAAFGVSSQLVNYYRRKFYVND